MDTLSLSSTPVLFQIIYHGLEPKIMASITYGWNLETILRALGISRDYTKVDFGYASRHRDQLRNSIALLQPRIEDYDGLQIWLMCLQDSEVNLRESKMVGISCMIGGYVPELFWSLAPNEAVNDPIPVGGFISLMKFFTDLKSEGIVLPAPTVHFTGWHAEKLTLEPDSVWLN